MSIYSVDSLENIDSNLNIDNTSNKNNIVINLKRKDDKSVKLQNHYNHPFYLKHLTPLSSSINNGEGSNETVQNCIHDRKPNTLRGRNAIIAKGKLAKASRRLGFSTTTTTTTMTRRKEIEGTEVKREKQKSANPNEKRKKNANDERRVEKKEEKKEEKEEEEEEKDDRLSGKPMGFFSKAAPSSTKCSFHVESIDDEKATTEMTVKKAHGKLANVLSTSDVQSFKKIEVSYLDVYRHKSSLPRYKRVIRSPEGSNLSIYGDSLREELVIGGIEEEGDGRISFSGFSRDDQSELSFYHRRLIERSATRFPQTIRSCETLRPLCVSTDSPKSTDNFTRIRTPFKSNLAESRLPKKLTYKPYTIEDYRSLPIPKPDRSLGPDKEEILAKREWLMRRRSYGDSVSERNRQQILHTAQRFKSRRIAPRKCFLPSLKHRDTDLKIHSNSSITEKTVNERNDNAERKNHLKSSSTKIAISKKNAENSLTKKNKKKEEKSFNRSVDLNSSINIEEDSYLDSLQKRHLREKELIDKLIKQAINS